MVENIVELVESHGNVIDVSGEPWMSEKLKRKRPECLIDRIPFSRVEIGEILEQVENEGFVELRRKRNAF